ncbi:Hypothetical protein NGAL_HAMBI2605_64400 [Neorhizobium galegae bv. orientalis]|nr:Hypothetical protein NGAL_HAMBI2605_64400 [Neorhizobium galegae bv. orientalis]
MANVTLSPANQTPQIIQGEEQNLKIKLSQSAKDLLSLPIDEMIISGQQVNWGDVETSIKKLMETLANDTGPGSRDADNNVTSAAVVRAFWEKFCDIPPFCFPRPASGSATP